MMRNMQRRIGCTSTAACVSVAELASTDGGIKPQFGEVFSFQNIIQRDGLLDDVNLVIHDH